MKTPKNVKAALKLFTEVHQTYQSFKDLNFEIQDDTYIHITLKDPDEKTFYSVHLELITKLADMFNDGACITVDKNGRIYAQI